MKNSKLFGLDNISDHTKIFKIISDDNSDFKNDFSKKIFLSCNEIIN
ncbi:MAG: hypothetical protein U9Q66_01840 [Patescibacteria group bacterium]|nr:hypothetical protein [Patescibacteria group bacterium]